MLLVSQDMIDQDCSLFQANFTRSPVSDIFCGMFRAALFQHGAKESAMLEPFFTLPLDIQVSRNIITSVHLFTPVISIGMNTVTTNNETVRFGCGTNELVQYFKVIVNSIQLHYYPIYCCELSCQDPRQSLMNNNLTVVSIIKEYYIEGMKRYNTVLFERKPVPVLLPLNGIQP